MSYDNFNALMAELAEREMEKDAGIAREALKYQREAAARAAAKAQAAAPLSRLDRAKAHLMANKGKYALGAGALGLGGAYLYNRRK
jgi:hypothetical protein